MLGLKNVCTLLLAGGIGAGSVVAVQKVQPAVQKAKPRASAPKVHKTANQQVTHQQEMNCPTSSMIGPNIAFSVPNSEFLPPLGAGSTPSQSAAVPGRGVPIFDQPVVPGVPAPDTWVMLLAGFGLIGFAIRRTPRRREEAPVE